MNCASDIGWSYDDHQYIGSLSSTIFFATGMSILLFVYIVLQSFQGVFVATDTKTSIQVLSDLVEWFISDRAIELHFVPNKRKTGKIAPEFNFEYWLDGRRITDRAVAALIMMELMRRN